MMYVWERGSSCFTFLRQVLFQHGGEKFYFFNKYLIKPEELSSVVLVLVLVLVLNVSLNHSSAVRKSLWEVHIGYIGVAHWAIAELVSALGGLLCTPKVKHRQLWPRYLAQAAGIVKHYDFAVW